PDLLRGPGAARGRQRRRGPGLRERRGHDRRQRHLDRLQPELHARGTVGHDRTGRAPVLHPAHQARRDVRSRGGGSGSRWRVPLPDHAGAAAELIASRRQETPMHIGLVGLGKMGGNMRTRMRNAGLTVIGYDRDPELSDVGSLAEMVEQLPSPKVVWVMVPHGAPTRETVEELAGLLGEGDVVVDGGNSRWTDDEIHAALLAEKKIGYVDCGVSGGVWGLENGYALMAGGSAEDVAKVQPAFDAL